MVAVAPLEDFLELEEPLLEPLEFDELEELPPFEPDESEDEEPFEFVELLLEPEVQHPFCDVEPLAQHPLVACDPLAQQELPSTLASAWPALGNCTEGSPANAQPFAVMNRPITMTMHAPAVMALRAKWRERLPATAPSPSMSGTVPSAKHSMDAPPARAPPLPSA